MGLRDLLKSAATWTGRNKFASLIIITGAMYLATYPFVSPPVMTQAERKKL